MLYGSTTYAAGIQLTTKLWKILSRLTPASQQESVCLTANILSECCVLLCWQANHTKVPSHPKHRSTKQHSRLPPEPCARAEQSDLREKLSRNRRNMRGIYDTAENSVRKPLIRVMPCHNVRELFIHRCPHGNLINSLFRGRINIKQRINQICLKCHLEIIYDKQSYLTNLITGERQSLENESTERRDGNLSKAPLIHIKKSFCTLCWMSLLSHV